MLALKCSLLSYYPVKEARKKKEDDCVGVGGGSRDREDDIFLAF